MLTAIAIFAGLVAGWGSDSFRALVRGWATQAREAVCPAAPPDPRRVDPAAPRAEAPRIATP